MTGALRSALAFGTVLPSGRDCAVDGRTVTALPVAGLMLGAVAGGVWWAGNWLFGSHSLLAGLLAVVTLLLLTRGLHLDGLADTADGLGCYGPADRALAVMRDGAAGPFGVAAIVVMVSAQAAGFAALPTGLTGVAAVVTAVVTGRVAAVLAVRRGVPAAPGSTLGAMVAGTQSGVVVICWAVAAAGLSVLAAPRVWQGPLIVAGALLVAAALVGHCVRRFGGVTGDVIGAAVEVATTLTAVGLAIRP
ncbi:MAG TPA: adenosylcobinamide-GDP ribazoletransferase [Mycobacterium sp.]|nr:adenosylcobinamide-GDP ribazoletransferase [Mycobacterium sp.]HQE14300.1 adenosylcobinamide-GDP ribazoletransferase [Mycobacterium sp.]